MQGPIQGFKRELRLQKSWGKDGRAFPPFSLALGVWGSPSGLPGTASVGYRHRVSGGPFNSPHARA